MVEIVEIPVIDLLLSSDNPRLSANSPTQQETALELAQQQGDNIIKLAADIVAEGLDPTSLAAVVATGDRRKQYRVLEGNRRILAVRALETPALISPVLSRSGNRRLTQLSAEFEKNPIEMIRCVLFATEADALHWIELRHTGQNKGVGLVEWGSDEKARFQERHDGKRHPARQFIEFVEKFGELSDAAQASRRKILTNVERIIGTPYAREKLGFDLVQGQLVALCPTDELAKALSRVVEDLKTGKVTVPDLYHVKDRHDYVDALPRSTLPKRSTRLKSPVLLDDLVSGAKKPRTVAVKKGRLRRPTRTTVIPSTARLDVTHPRINAIYNELLNLSAEQFPNASAVLLRVFIELSVDHFITEQNLMKDADLRNAKLGNKLRMAAKDLHSRGLIPVKLRNAIETVAGGRMFGSSVFSLHQYVHNECVYPKTSELYATWDELEPFALKLWPPS